MYKSKTYFSERKRLELDEKRVKSEKVKVKSETT